MNSCFNINRFAWIAVLLSGASACSEDAVSFRSDIAPLLLEHCVACHGAKNAEGGYRVDTYAELIKAGDSEAKPIASSPGEASELLRRLTMKDSSERMPADAEPLSERQIGVVSRWIAGGAVFDGQDESQQLAFVIPPPRHVDPPLSYPTPVPITAVAFTPDGTQVLTAGYHEVAVWDVADAKLVRRIHNIGQRVFAIAFNAEGTELAVACGEPGQSGEVRLVDFATGEVKAVLARSTDVILDVAFRPGSKQLAVASADNVIRIVDTETLTGMRTLPSHADWVTAVAWSDDGSRLVSASRDKSAKLFDVDAGQLLISYQGHGAAVKGVAFSPDGKHVMSTGADGKLHRWNVQDAKKVAEVALGSEGFQVIRGDAFVLVPCADKRVLKIDLKNNKVAHEFKGHSDWVLSVALQADGSHVISGSFDGEVRLWNVADATLQQRWLAKH